jgi:hypothetical protein
LRDLETRLMKEGRGVELGEDERVPGLFFADDMVILAEGGDELQRLLFPACPEGRLET